MQNSVRAHQGVGGVCRVMVAAAWVGWCACALHGQEAAAVGTQVKEPPSRQEPVDVSEAATLATTEWGRLGTLRVRAMMPRKVSLAELFTGKVEFAWEKGPLPASAPKTILKRDLEFQGILHFKHAETGKEFEVAAESRWSGMPPGNSHDTTELDVAADGQWNWDCRWRANRGGTELAPGLYDVSVEVVTWKYTRTTMERGLSLMSAPVRIEVTPVEYEIVTVLLPKGQQLADGRWVSTGAELEEVEIKVTKGYQAMMSHNSGKKPLPTKERVGEFERLFEVARFTGDQKAIRPVAPAVRFTIFETCTVEARMPAEKGFGYRVVLERVYVISPGSGR